MQKPDKIQTVSSKIFLTEKVKNKDKKNAANLHYYPAFIVDEYGNETYALFTTHNIKTAQARAEKNPEDKPPTSSGESSNIPWYKKLFNFLVFWD